MPVGVQQKARKKQVSDILIWLSNCSSLLEKLSETLGVKLKLYPISSSSWKGWVKVM